MVDSEDIPKSKPEEQCSQLNIKEKELDMYRDTFVRYMGYSNELGEAFRPLISRSLVGASYGIAIGYVCLDAFDKSLRHQISGASNRDVALIGGDVFTWQMFASVIIPGLVINRVTATSRSLLKNAPPLALKTLPTILGLVTIPFIVHPIDNLVDQVMDATFRKILR
ncbi:mitochondrial fission process protein 1 [Scaptodrosophila lebanonensis]|uniref:Mitochondrial fission process protein 1 n=1 Tax=Drosophila lebanonensis TaxID=7225 RepID=A0A6J2TQB8_DROLE|nr:mitochondrial fission process protein 1 [Scaptodrosophila lebanonensis]